jgi:hypothetical protein
VIDVGVGHGAEQRQLVGLAGKARQMLAHAEAWGARRDGLELAAVLGRGVGLWIPGILLCRTAPHKEEDTGARLARAFRGSGGSCLEQFGQTEPEQAEASDAQQLAPAHRRQDAVTLTGSASWHGAYP